VSFFSKLPGRVGAVFSGIAHILWAPFKTAYNAFAGFVSGIGDVIDKIAEFVHLPQPGWHLNPWTDPVEANASSDGTGSFAPIQFAKGGRVDRPTKAIIGEAGHTEYVLTTDPSQKPGTMALLGQFMGELAGKKPKAMGGPGLGDIPGVDNIAGAIGDAWSFGTGAIGSALGAGGDILGAIKSVPGQLFDMARGAAAAAFKRGVDMIIKLLPEHPEFLRGLGRRLRDDVGGWVGGEAYDKGQLQSFDLMKIFSDSAVMPTQSWGRTGSALSLYGDQFHHGVDIARVGGGGMPLHGPGGEASVTATGELGGYGNRLNFRAKDKQGAIIDFLLGHLADPAHVKVGDRISAQDIIGMMGTTGNSTGIHTHVQAWGDGGAEVNPQKFFPNFDWFWGSDLASKLPGMAKGGFVKPNSMLVDAFGHPYAQVGENGPEVVSPLDFLKNNLSDLAGQIAGRLSNTRLPAGGEGARGDTYTFSVGDIHANTAADAQAIADKLESTWESWLDKLPAHSQPVLSGRNR